ncbi:MAG: hypothetical protein ABR576_06655 [Thermoanaerobaculia bacterium]
MRARRTAAALALLLLAVSEVRGLWRDAVRRARVAVTGVDSRLDGTGFAFDPAYGPFLYAADASAPDGAPLAVAAPRSNELYTYQAHYTLAPRRVTASHERSGYRALYGPGSPAEKSRKLPGGVLLRR